MEKWAPVTWQLLTKEQQVLFDCWSYPNLFNTTDTTPTLLTPQQYKNIVSALVTYLVTIKEQDCEILYHPWSVEIDTDGAISRAELLKRMRAERSLLRRQRKQQNSLSQLRDDITGGFRVEIYSPTCIHIKTKNWTTDSWPSAANELHVTPNSCFHHHQLSDYYFLKLNNLF